MKTFFCPHCGEKSLSTLQKNSGKWHDFTALDRTLNKIFFSCNNCGKEVSHSLTPRGSKTYRIWFIAMAAIVSVLCGISAITKGAVSAWILLIPTIPMLVWAHIIDSKNQFFKRKDGKYQDILIDAKVEFKNKVDFFDCAIYVFRPSEKYINLSGVSGTYVVALSHCDWDKGTCKLRVIKPNDVSIKSGIMLDIYGDRGKIGTAII